MMIWIRVNYMNITLLTLNITLRISIRSDRNVLIFVTSNLALKIGRRINQDLINLFIQLINSLLNCCHN